jgi:hypothetical protein
MNPIQGPKKNLDSCVCRNDNLKTTLFKQTELG